MRFYLCILVALGVLAICQAAILKEASTGLEFGGDAAAFNELTALNAADSTEPSTGGGGTTDKSFGDKAKEFAGKVKEKASGFMGKLKEKATQLKDKVKNMVGGNKENGEAKA